jgi:hypothetical protein
VDLVRRLLDLDFRRSVKTLDEAENLYTVLREAGAGEGDMVGRSRTLDCSYHPALTLTDMLVQVLDAALVVYLAVLSQDERALEPILRRQGLDCFSVVGKMLSNREDGFALARSVTSGKTIRSKDRAAVTLVNGPFGQTLFRTHR